MAEEPKVTAPTAEVPGDKTPEHDVEPEADKKDEELSRETLLAQKAHWRTKAKKLEEKLKLTLPAPAPAAPAPAAPAAPSKENPSNDSDSRLAAIELAMKHRDLDAEDLNELGAVMKAKGLTPEQAREDRLFKGYQSEKARLAREAGAIPGTPARAPKLESEADFDSITPEQISAMDSATFAKFEAYMRQKQKRR